MSYSITGQNSLGKWRLVRPTKAIAEKVAKAKRRVLGNKNVRVHAGRGIVGKQAVLGARERTGKVMAVTTTSTEQDAIHDFIAKHVYPGATVFTDEHGGYIGLKGYKHESLNHSAGEYVRGQAHTNGIESFWALLKRGYYGTFHHFSIKHANRYINEFATRNNNRDCDTVDVLAITAKSTIGKLLPYKELVYGPSQS